MRKIFMLCLTGALALATTACDDKGGGGRFRQNNLNS